MAADIPGSKNRGDRIAPHAANTGCVRMHEKSERIVNRSPEQIQRLLRKRALILAEEKIPESGSRDVGLVGFTLDGEGYGVESICVDRIDFVENLTQLPCTPAFLRGVVNLRGEIIPVVDLAELFELRDRESADFGCVIVLLSGKTRFGILVHAISGMRDVAPTDIRRLPVTFTGRGGGYLKGVTIDGLVVLDAEKLLADKSLVIDEHVHG